MLGETLGLFDDHVGDLHVAAGGFVEGRRHDFATYRALHLRDFLGTLINEKHHKVDFGAVRNDGRGDVLQQHRLTGLRRRDDQTALTFADRGHHVDDACREIFGTAVTLLELQAFFREQRRQVLEQHLGACVLGRVVIDLPDLEQREIALAVLGRTNQAGYCVAGAQREAPNLAGTDIDIVRSGKIGAVGGTQEAETVLQDLEYALAVNVLALGRMCLQDREDHVLLARPRHVLDAEGLAEFDQLRCRTGLQLRQVHHVLAGFELLGRNDLEVVVVVRVNILRRPAAPPTIYVPLAFVARLVRAIFR